MVSRVTVLSRALFCVFVWLSALGLGSGKSLTGVSLAAAAAAAAVDGRIDASSTTLDEEEGNGGLVDESAMSVSATHSIALAFRIWTTG